MVALYAVTICTSAALLFLVQPMFARMVLPLLGGSPAVWNTAMVFFQAALLAGYAYAHAATARLGARRHALLHLIVLLLPLAVLPIAVPAGWSPPSAGDPTLWLLAVMTVGVGLPFLVVSTTSPLLQTWFAATGHRQGRDPYFLYAASNVGSMLALLSYPVVIEPHLRLADQSRYWMYGYWLLAVLLALCAATLWLGRRWTAEAVVDSPAPAAAAASPKPTTRQRLRWVLLAFVPSSLMLGVTTYLSSDIAVVPLMWIVPLAIYLLTFILAFARKQILPRMLLVRAFPILVIALAMLLNLQATQPIAGIMGLHLGTFFVAALLCHAQLAADRPPAAHLTEFYLWLSAGGVLGGMFNALVAPLVFNSIVEYPLTLVLACLVGLQTGKDGSGISRRDWIWPLALGAVTTGLVLLVQASSFRTNLAITGLLFGVPAIVCFLFSRHPLRFALGVAAMLFAGSFFQREKGTVLFAERSFFGVNRVMLDPTGKYHLLIHGLTLHGSQSLDSARRREALTYYHATGPAGEVLSIYGRNPQAQIAVVGLGAGSLASYARSGQAWTYYEIDPAVLRIAQDERFFSFLRDSPATVRTVLGDARLSLAQETDERFDVLVVDAFSSDAIPMHLVTREALALYLQKLAPRGVIAFHISNVHLDLEPVFADLARDAGVACLVRDDTAVAAEDYTRGKSPSVWLVMARQPADLAQLAADSRWQRARVTAQASWTDDYSSLLSVFRWQ